MRTHHQIRSDIAKAQADYEVAVRDLPAAGVVPFKDALVALKDELSASLCPGAQPCETCGRQPMGLRHVRGSHRRVMRGAGLVTVTFWRHAFEVGCANCGDKRAVEETPEEESAADLDKYDDIAIASAVSRWNEETYLASRGS